MSRWVLETEGMKTEDEKRRGLEVQEEVSQGTEKSAGEKKVTYT
jgi:hypothetical protein